ncbi:MAG: hypothetical protein L6R37_005350 [Teloschistes peruensis]|nr:MAG: hypothetical protein L6R37_005350 [Teloschistes peruensis]
MMAPLSGTSTGSAGKASPHLQAWLDEKKAAEEKKKQQERALEGEGADASEKKNKGFKSALKSVFRPMGYPKEEWEAEKGKEGGK